MQKRNVLWWLLLFLTICNTLVTMNINIAIVSMVKSPRNEKFSLQSGPACSNSTVGTLNPEEENQVHTQQLGFDWSEADQNMVLSGYYWLNYISILPGGVIAHKFGSKRVVGYTQAISSIMSSLIPIFAEYGPTSVAWIRAVQGLLSFMSVPAGICTIFGKWSPPQESGKFGAAFPTGTTVGFLFGSFIFGYIAEYIHWTYVFHLTSVCGLTWTVFWYYLIYDSPQQHPTISFVEKKYIEDSLYESKMNNKDSIPWIGISTNVPFIAGILALNSLILLFVVIATYTPVYYKSLYGLNANEIGILTSFPQLFNGLLCLCLAYFSDISLKKKILSITNLRKLCSLFGSLFAVLPLIIIPFFDCDINLAIWGIMWCSIMKGFGNFGPFLIVVDMSPTFCGVLEGFSGTLSSITTFIFSALINYLTTIWDIDAVWKFTFLFTASYVILTNLVFWIFGSAEIQSFNFKVHEKEAIPQHKPELRKMLAR